ncbi:glycosyltransferase family 4 protein [Cyanobium sp. WAJ14-Wanaka]|uniref:glycosyltransferase family 4 protein n=1 Tax=Cyanobium sp. WAJ14-Wanaka TaxID=2823725 RepID=UPI0020CF40AD|nr:glycosyltransferase family 4 protein [Cyanobium sp. WAJ14-Wanaka]MCP9775684.1 glycosyltransferase family 4 protein [Cyanobium sp. WAJ14-Wanaka]
MKQEVLQVLHLAPHIGGGVGSVLVDWLKNARDDTSTKHTIACLDTCKPATVQTLNSEKITYHDNLWKHKKEKLRGIINAADIVILHYWNHPLLSRLLIEDGLPASRLICWCHISGLYEPCIIPEFLIDMCDKVIFSSSISKNAATLAGKILVNPEKFVTIHSSRDLRPYLRMFHKRKYPKIAHRLVYIGTVSFSKLHPDTIEIMSRLSRMGFDLTVIGGPDHEYISRQIPNDAHRIRFLGPKENIHDYLLNSDIFVYPLSPSHYGTGEQSILEAMASGMPVISFSNPAESAIIIDQRTGRLVSNADEFVESIIPIARSASLRQWMGEASATEIQKRFCEEKNKDTFNLILESASRQPKQKRNAKLIQSCNMDICLLAFLLTSFSSTKALNFIKGSSEEEERLHSISNYIAGEIENGKAIWKAPTKGTPLHYENYFPKSRSINLLVKKITQNLCAKT